MKRTNELHTGNVLASRRGTPSVANIPRIPPYPRHVRKFRRSGLPKIQWPKWIGMPSVTYGLFKNAGLMVVE